MEYKRYLTYTQFNLSKKAGFELKIHKSCVASKNHAVFVMGLKYIQNKMIVHLRIL